jgi:hypothetical protein
MSPSVFWIFRKRSVHDPLHLRVALAEDPVRRVKHKADERAERGSAGELAPEGAAHAVGDKQTVDDLLRALGDHALLDARLHGFKPAARLCGQEVVLIGFPGQPLVGRRRHVDFDFGG